jgi:ketosteroid isomerase-like protein
MPSMFKRILTTSLISLVALIGTVRAQSSTAAEHPDDAAAIKAHIGSIFQAFIDRDIDKIRETHSEDWRGFLEGSSVPIKGIDEYMRANGIEWPLPANAPKPKPSPNPSRTYAMKDFDVIFYNPELAAASFVGEFMDKETSAVQVRYRIMDIYAKRQGKWIQVASHTVIDPAWRAEQTSQPASIGRRMREQILAAREKVWKAYFENDRAALERLIPDEVITIDPGSEEWSNKARVLSGAKGFAESGAKLVKLEFPKTEMQVYGNTVLIYTTFLYEIESGGKKNVRTGRATEMFVRRGDDLVNVGWHLDAGP